MSVYEIYFVFTAIFNIHFWKYFSTQDSDSDSNNKQPQKPKTALAKAVQLLSYCNCFFTLYRLVIFFRLKKVWHSRNQLMHYMILCKKKPSRNTVEGLGKSSLIFLSFLQYINIVDLDYDQKRLWFFG